MTQDFNQLHAALAVARHRNFRAAAQALDMSPTALSRAISALEQRLGLRLFNRTTRSVSVTDAGEAFLARVEPALVQLNDALEGANQIRDTPVGTLRINASEGAARIILRPIILRFLAQNPEMNIDLFADGSLSDIVAHGFDLGVRYAEAVPQDMIAVPLEPHHAMAVFAAPSYVEGRPFPRTPADLLAHSCVRIRHPSGTLYHWEFTRHGKDQRINVPGRLTVNSYNLAVDAALAGEGIGFTSEYFVREHFASGRLVRLLEEWTPPFEGLHLYYPRHRQVSAGLRAFIDMARGRVM